MPDTPAKHDWKTVVVAVCTAVAGVAGVASAHVKSKSVEDNRVRADQVLLERLDLLEDDVDALIGANEALEDELDAHYREHDALLPVDYAEDVSTPRIVSIPSLKPRHERPAAKKSARPQGQHDEAKENKRVESIIEQRAY